jgi:hypothetical protein
MSFDRDGYSIPSFQESTRCSKGHNIPTVANLVEFYWSIRTYEVFRDFQYVTFSLATAVCHK